MALGGLFVWLRARTLTWPQIGLAAALFAGFAHGHVDAFQSLPDLAAWNWVALALLLWWPSSPADSQPPSPQ
jgi:hypothetical protein